METDYDIIIVGGGMVGSSLACALQQLPLRIAVVERFQLRSTRQPSFDDRSIALSLGTSRIFQALGLWQDLSELAAPIERIHISDRGQFGATRLDCRDFGADALGYVVESREIGRVLQQQLAQQSQIDWFCPATVADIHIHPERAQVFISSDDGEQTLSAALVVAADGADSVVREKLCIQASVRDYGQTALIANVAVANDHQQVAYERFTDTGPLALLPMRADVDSGAPRCALVWTVANERADEVLQLPDRDFLAQLQQRFGRRLGAFTRIGQRASYPLRLVRAQSDTSSHVVLIGNAAHTLHPVAGQGYNLGMRDAAVLAEVVAQACAEGLSLSNPVILERYQAWRKQDQRNVVLFTDTLVRVFSSRLMSLRLGRSLGLSLLDCVPPAKRQLALHTMGLAGKLPRLARGLSFG